ncbi:hypothetical protein RRG08_003145 [Elysia crispata]|uniref:Uncharacterized protein n=1 Tax=Elysia crispata TaxID=231223 RepID=A0AAE1B7P8_9GAST|nr:hypothetical protein RRG08_003145 [Elysia crispata]
MEVYRVYKEWCGERNRVAASRQVFVDEFDEGNYAIFRPRMDQCDMCVSYKDGNVDEAPVFFRLPLSVLSTHAFHFKENFRKINSKWHAETKVSEEDFSMEIGSFSDADLDLSLLEAMDDPKDPDFEADTNELLSETSDSEIEDSDQFLPVGVLEKPSVGEVEERVSSIHFLTKRSQEWMVTLELIIKRFYALRVGALGEEKDRKINDMHRVSQGARSLARLLKEVKSLIKVWDHKGLL